MPTDESGIKWACVSCVRGHRATRCGHFDRWMVRVRKPGRPLRECPHAKGPCTCSEEMVIMMKIPLKDPKGGCMCRKVRDPDAIPDGAAGSPPSVQPPQQDLRNTGSIQYGAATSPPLHQPRQQDPSSPSQVMPCPIFQPTQPLPAPPDTQQVGLRDQIANLRVSTKLAKRKHARNLRPRRSRRNVVQSAMQPEQHATDSSSSDPTTPTKDGPFCCQEDLNLVAQPPSPTTVQGKDLAQPFLGDSNLFSDLIYPPAQPNGTQFPPRLPPYNPEQNPSNNDHAQEGHDVSIPTFHPPLDSMTQHAVNPAPDTTFDQSIFPTPLDRTRHKYPGSQNGFSTHDSAGVRPPAFATFPTRPGCLCGKGCNCTMCNTHPWNKATQKCMNEMTKVLASDHYPDGNPHLSQPKSGTGGTLSKGINTESAVGQGHPPLADNKAVDLNTSGWNNVPDGGTLHQPPVNQGESVSNNNLSNHYSSPTIQNSEYYDVAYPLLSNYSDASGMCLGVSGCLCEKCFTIGDYNGLLS